MTKHDPFIEDRYFQEFAGREMARTTTVKNKAAMRLYLEYYRDVLGMEMTPTLFLERIQDDRTKDPLESGTVEKEWNGFIKWLMNDYCKYNYQRKKTNKQLSARSVALYGSAIKSFYSYFHFPFSQRAQFPREITQSDGVAANKRIEYRPANVKQLLSGVKSLRDRAIILWMFQSGMDISTTMSITYGEIKDDYERGVVPLSIHTTRFKTRKNFTTFVGPDAIEAIRVYFRDRQEPRHVCEECGRSWKVNRAICPNRKCRGHVSEMKRKVKAEDYLFERTTKSIANASSEVEGAMRKYVIISGVISKDRLKRADMNPAGSHALRSSFSSILQVHGVNKDIVNGFTGHKVDYNGAYSRTTHQELSKTYSNVMQELQVTGVTDPGELQERVERLEKQVREQEELLEIFAAMVQSGERGG